MKVLVITRNAWDDTNATGNTLSNFFMGLKNVEFASLYFRASKPDNKLCKNYFHVTEVDVVKKWFTPRKIGKSFSLGEHQTFTYKVTTQKKEKNLVQFVRSHNCKLAYWISDCVWYGKKWQNDNLSKFITNFAPDIVVTFAKSSPQYFSTIKYIREQYNIPVFSWIADDEYTALAKKNSLKKIRNLSYILRESAVVRGCSQPICDYYNSVFHCNATPLYKGCEFSASVRESVNNPLKIVYAGNLLYGRIEIIRRLSEILDCYDPCGERVSFNVYSNTELSYKDEMFFLQRRCTKFLGCRKYEEIKNKMSSADVILHVESFENDQILKTKYSFSTKIIDGLQSGGVMLAIGPAVLASIAYIKQIPGACVIDNKELLEERLTEFLDDRYNFVERSRSIRAFAQEHHNHIVNAKNIELLLKKTMENKV